MGNAYAILQNKWADTAKTLINDGRTWLCHKSNHGSAACTARRHDVGSVFWLLRDKGVTCCKAWDIKETFCPLEATKCNHWYSD